MGMDFGGSWAAALSGLPKTSNAWVELVFAVLQNPWTRSLALIVIVYFTIRVIASIYSGDKQGAEIGPIAIRKHSSARLNQQTLCLHREMMEMNMDGVTANVKVLYVYTDANGRRRSQVVHGERNIRLSISPQKLRRAEKIDGQEITDVPTADVCFPPFESEKPIDPILPMKERARDYAEQHEILKHWHDDDGIPLISTGIEFKEQVASGKDLFILERVAQMEAAKGKNIYQRWKFRRLRKNRPNVVGSYYLKFEFSHDPMFVLTRHPDKDLKMTAWLTILTSMFALIMGWWPQGSAPFGFVPPSEIVRVVDHPAPPRTARVVIP
jgi:hypothetical protein